VRAAVVHHHVEAARHEPLRHTDTRLAIVRDAMQVDDRASPVGGRDVPSAQPDVMSVERHVPERTRRPRRHRPPRRVQEGRRRPARHLVAHDTERDEEGGEGRDTDQPATLHACIDGGGR
jgi:hypothetical protein